MLFRHISWNEAWNIESWWWITSRNYRHARTISPFHKAFPKWDGHDPWIPGKRNNWNLITTLNNRIVHLLPTWINAFNLSYPKLFLQARANNFHHESGQHVVRVGKDHHSGWNLLLPSRIWLRWASSWIPKKSGKQQIRISDQWHLSKQGWTGARDYDRFARNQERVLLAVSKTGKGEVGKRWCWVQC